MDSTAFIMPIIWAPYFLVQRILVWFEVPSSCLNHDHVDTFLLACPSTLMVHSACVCVHLQGPVSVTCKESLHYNALCFYKFSLNISSTLTDLSRLCLISFIISSVHFFTSALFLLGLVCNSK